MDSGNVILPVITLLGPEDFILFVGYGVAVIILLNVLLMIWILKMSNLRGLELINLISKDSKES